MSRLGRSLAFAFATTVVGGCWGHHEPAASSESHFLECHTDRACEVLGPEFACIEGHCQKAPLRDAGAANAQVAAPPRTTGRTTTTDPDSTPSAPKDTGDVIGGGSAPADTRDAIRAGSAPTGAPGGMDAGNVTDPGNVMDAGVMSRGDVFTIGARTSGTVQAYGDAAEAGAHVTPIGQEVRLQLVPANDQQVRRGIAEFSADDLRIPEGAKVAHATLTLGAFGSAGGDSFPVIISDYLADLHVTSSDFDREATDVGPFDLPTPGRGTLGIVPVTSAVQRAVAAGSALGFRIRFADEGVEDPQQLSLQGANCDNSSCDSDAPGPELTIYLEWEAPAADEPSSTTDTSVAPTADADGNLTVTARASGTVNDFAQSHAGPFAIPSTNQMQLELIPVNEGEVRRGVVEFSAADLRIPTDATVTHATLIVDCVGAGAENYAVIVSYYDADLAVSRFDFDGSATDIGVFDLPMLGPGGIPVTEAVQHAVQNRTSVGFQLRFADETVPSVQTLWFQGTGCDDQHTCTIDGTPPQLLVELTPPP